METSFFHYTMIIFSSAQGRVTLKWIIQSSWNLNSYEMLGLSCIPASLAKIRSKMTEKRWRYHFQFYKSMCAFSCHDNHIFYLIYPKTKCNRSTTPWMLHIKFDQSWQTGLRDIHVWKCKYVYGIFLALKGTYLQSDWSDPTGILNRSRFYAVLVISKFDEDPIKNER